MKTRASMLPTTGKQILATSEKSPYADIAKTVKPKKVVKFTEEKKEISAPPAGVTRTPMGIKKSFKFEHLESAGMSSLFSMTAKRMTTKSRKTAASSTKSVRVSDEQRLLAEQLKLGKKELVAGGEDTIEIGLVLDITGSMQNWIDRAKETIIEIIDKVVKDSEEEGKVVPKISFIGYRDHFDADRFLVKPFTTNVDDIKEFISHAEADGGYDNPEDVVGGLKLCLMQDWSQMAGKKVFFIADAPCHGTKYHVSREGDEYPEGSPDGLVLEDLMQEFAEKDIDFNIVKLDNCMNKMVDIMWKSHGNVEVQDFSLQMAKIAKTTCKRTSARINEEMTSTYVEHCTSSMRMTVAKSRSTKC